MRHLNNIDLSECYKRAKTSFDECFAEKDNELLALEVQSPLKQILVKEDSVRITFDEQDKSNYLLETRLLLFSDAHTSLGYYCVHQNKDGGLIDDFLVFE